PVAVQPRAAHSPFPGVADPGAHGHVLEAAAAVVEEMTGSQHCRDVQILPAIVVIITDGAPHAVEADIETGGGRYILEPLPRHVPEQCRGRTARPAAGQRRAIDAENVEPAV